MKQLILILSVIVLILASCQERSPKKTILVIFAHPDDETTIGPMMAKYAKSNRVIYLVATDGRYGTRVNKIPQDSLINIRKAECACSGEALGIDPPVFLGFHDGLGIRTGIGEYFKQMSELRKVLKSRIEEVHPDMIITFGPDGDSGHADHRVVGDITTEIILREGWVDKFPVYYLAWTKDQAAKFDVEALSYVDADYFNVSVSFSQEDENKYFESIRCYKSQNTQQEIADWITSDRKDNANVLYFRKLAVEKGVRKEF